jgi:hypothetical protein
MEGYLLFPYNVKGVLKMRTMTKLPFISLFMPKRKSRGAMWASLIGLGLSAAVFGVTKGKRRDIVRPLQNAARPLQNAVRSITPKTNIDLMDNAALAEFSEELLESALRDKE